MNQNAHSFSLTTLDGKNQPLSAFAGKALLFVNVASKCGFTSQYKGLQALSDKMSDKGVVVVGVPCNQFGAQEPGTAEQIQTFCSTTYGVTFPMMAKVDVNGPSAHPLYQWLTSQGAAGPVKWNFAKFVVGKDGAFVARFDSGTTPESPELAAALAKAAQ
jgi:glutathione peroxidase